MLPAAARLHSEPVTRYHIRAGLVAYSYRKELGDKTMTYPDIIRMLGDWGIDGLDCTAYWFPDT